MKMPRTEVYGEEKRVEELLSSRSKKRRLLLLWR